MKKYLLNFRMAFLDQMEYRADLVLKILMRTVPVIGFYYLWKAAYAAGNFYTDYKINDIVTYFLITTSIDLILPTFTVISSFGDEIREGSLSSHLLKPFNFRLARFFYIAGERLITFCLSSMFIVSIVLVYGQVISFPPNLWIWLAFIISAILSMTLAYWVFFTFGLANFWIIKSMGYAFILETLAGFLRGSFVPLDLMPKWFRFIANILPFKYTNFFTIQIFLSRLDNKEIIYGLLAQVSWICFFVLLNKLLWKTCLIKYDSSGA